LLSQHKLSNCLLSANQYLFVTLAPQGNRQATALRWNLVCFIKERVENSISGIDSCHGVHHKHLTYKLLGLAGNVFEVKLIHI
jgi:hypothetical protein